MGRAGRSAADVLRMRKLEGQSRCVCSRMVLAVDSEGASTHDSWSVMLFRLFKTQNSMEGVGEECLSRDGGGGDVGVLHFMPFGLTCSWCLGVCLALY